MTTLPSSPGSIFSADDTKQTVQPKITTPAQRKPDSSEDKTDAAEAPKKLRTGSRMISIAFKPGRCTVCDCPAGDFTESPNPSHHDVCMREGCYHIAHMHHLSTKDRQHYLARTDGRILGSGFKSVSISRPVHAAASDPASQMMTATPSRLDLYERLGLLWERLWGKALSAITEEETLSLPTQPPWTPAVYDSIPDLSLCDKEEFKARWLVLKKLFPEDPKLLEAYPTWLPGRVNRILIQEDYGDLTEIIERKHDSRDDSESTRHVLLMGNSGIGKSAYLAYLLLKRVSEKKMTALVWKERPSFCFTFSDSGVQKFDMRGGNVSNRLVGEKNVMCLCDDTPHPFIYDEMNWQIVHATSPHRQGWKGWVRQATASEVYKDTWTFAEVMALCQNERVRPLLAASYGRYGGNPRRVMEEFLKDRDQSWVVRRGMHDKNLQSRVIRFLDENPRMVGENFVDSFDIQNSNAIITLRPDLQGKVYKSKKRAPSILAVRELATPFIAHLVAQAALARGTAECRTLFYRMMADPLFHSSAGIIFERMLHQMVKRGCLIPCINAIDGGILRGVPAFVKAKSFEEFNDVKKIDWRSAPGQQSIKAEYFGRYLVPTAQNLTTADSILIDKSMSKPLIVLIQSIVGKIHDIETIGLDEINASLPADVSKGKWLLLFATYSSNPALKTLQPLKGDAPSIARWKKKLLQGIWRVPDEALWADK